MILYVSDTSMLRESSKKKFFFLNSTQMRDGERMAGEGEGGAATYDGKRAR